MNVSLDIRQSKNCNVVTLMAVGDIMLGRKVGSRMKNERPEWIFSKVIKLLRNADLVIANLETPLLDDSCTSTTKAKIPLKAPSKPSLEAIKTGYINILNIANNHILDYEEEGLLSTISSLNKNRIKYVGAGENLNKARRPLRINKNGLNLSFLSYCPSYNATKNKSGTAPMNVISICKDVRLEKKCSDTVVVSLHSGVEYSDYPTPGFIIQARKIIDAGADIIIGHHPHVPQGIEKYKHGIIAYSLGNFVFDMIDIGVRKVAYNNCLLVKKYGSIFPNYDNRVCQSMILEITITPIGIKSYKIHPVIIREDFRPEILSGTKKLRFAQRMETLNSNIGNMSLKINQILKKVEDDSIKDYLKHKRILDYIQCLFRLRPYHLSTCLDSIRLKLKNK